MERVIAIGEQDFAELRKNDCFYIDKSHFIRDWWKSRDSVTLISRPRRFGKTLNLRMLECFFSMKYAGKGEELFSGLSVWEDEEMRREQGSWPVIFLSFANIKEKNFQDACFSIYGILRDLCNSFYPLRENRSLTPYDKNFFDRIFREEGIREMPHALRQLSGILEKIYSKKVLIFLDEYDTPLQEAYVHGYWDEMSGYMRSLFNSTFKTNPSLGRSVMTGVTRISRETMFSDMNNLTVVSTTSTEYESCFGFTEEEVFTAMNEYRLSDRQEVKDWYDGFAFGNLTDIYNPWSITNYLKKRKIASYWANTSSNALASKLIREGEKSMQEQFSTLISGGEIEAKIDENVVFGELDSNPDAVWSLLLAGGYLKVIKVEKRTYTLVLTNREIRESFENMVTRWFDKAGGEYNAFQKALLAGDLRTMNKFMKDVALATVSFFDSGLRPSEAQPEKFYHGFVLGLSIDLRELYDIRSNRESGYGRYDVIFSPKKMENRHEEEMKPLDAIIMEFKVIDEEAGEKTLSDTAASALRQIENKKYEQELLDAGIPAERIRKYGFAFRGKDVLIQQG